MAVTDRDDGVAFAIGVICRWLDVYDRAEQIYKELPADVRAEIDGTELDTEALASVLAMRDPGLRRRTQAAMLVALDVFGSPVRRRRCGRMSST